MSTVVLTPTHIACDHTVLYRSYPHLTKVDMNHRKIFVAPNRKYIIGTVGQFIPELVDTPEMYDIFGALLSDFIQQQQEWGLVGQLAVPLDDIKERMNNSTLFKALDSNGCYIFLVTKRYRFILRRSDESKRFYGVRLDDYAGIGSGGMIATGLLRGGMKIHDIWEDLHKLDPMTSREHTIIPLSSLRSVRYKK